MARLLAAKRTLLVIFVVLLLIPIAQTRAADKTFQLKQVATDAKTVNQDYGDEFGTADVTAIELPDGRIRIYFGLMDGKVGGQIGSAISSDGINFTGESGTRVSRIVDGSFVKGASSPSIFKLSDGRYRIFFTGDLGVMSAISSDGYNFTREEGARLTRTAFLNPNFSQNSPPVCSAIVPISGGRYRMYCSQQVQQNAFHPNADRAIFSAVSNDLLTWTVEAGRRIGPGSSLPVDADHPTVIEASGDSVTLAYDQLLPNQDARIMIAKSTDGLNFTTEYFSGIYGNEAFYLKTSTGKEFLYYGKHDTKNGSTISVAIPGVIDTSNQKFRAKITCYAAPGLQVQMKIIEIYDFNPVCPKDYSTTPPGSATPTPTPTPTPVITPTPTPTPIATESATPLATPTLIAPAPVAKKTTITCVKGKSVKKVTGKNPKCPKGYKKK